MKTRIIKKLLACLLTVTCLFASMNTVVLADNSIVESYINSDYGVYSTFLKDYTSELTISGKTATCYSEATGNSSVTRIVGDMYLERYTASGWVDVDAWRMQCESNVYTNTKTKSNLISASYRLRTEFTVTARSGATETATIYSSIKFVTP